MEVGDALSSLDVSFDYNLCVVIELGSTHRLANVFDVILSHSEHCVASHDTVHVHLIACQCGRKFIIKDLRAVSECSRDILRIENQL
jgi:hypothetical protein